ncbi:MAG: peptide chain release factor N(5)-glutamine methyltransferase [Actinobacteria bacterium]|nr:peptide chain release factor N(5)-glutamine methyltransferase [Actinomycetota bacterium]
MSDPHDGRPEGTVTWGELLVETVARLRDGGIAAAEAEGRWLVEEASGLDAAEWIAGRDELATQRTVARLDDMVDRRLVGEPVQYVLGRWGFRRLDLLCDRRVLIPRPETEQVVEVALGALDQVLMARPDGHRPTVVDLGTGSGAIALSVAAERNGVDVWGVDASADALDVARANLGGLGMAGGRVRLLHGSWYDPLPSELRGIVDLVVANPPYVAEDEALDASVADWEPAGALVPGPTGLEAYGEIVSGAGEWLADGGVLVVEIGATQADAVRALAEDAGLDDVTVHADHAGLDRAVVARRS